VTPQPGPTDRPVVIIDGQPLSVADVVAVARYGAAVAVAPEAAARMAPARGVVERIVAEGA
jgi:histidine ammonia-lyase